MDGTLNLADGLADGFPADNRPIDRGADQRADAGPDRVPFVDANDGPINGLPNANRCDGRGRLRAARRRLLPTPWAARSGQHHVMRQNLLRIGLPVPPISRHNADPNCHG